MDKKMYKYIGILVGLVVLLVVVVWISNLVSGGTTYSYESIEKKMVSATKSYMKDHSAMLPTEVGESVTISPTVLVNNNYFKGFDVIMITHQLLIAEINTIQRSYMKKF